MATVTSINTAGVTFSNQDGQKRQDIICELASKQRFYEADLKETTFNSMRAVEVWIKGKQIGYVPATYLMCAISRFYKLTAEINYYRDKNIWFVTLSMPQSPTPSQKNAILNFCQANGFETPIDDIRAYAEFYQTHSTQISANKVASVFSESTTSSES